MVAIGVGLDLDILFKEAHRGAWTHSIFTLPIAIPFLVFGSWYFLLVSLAILLHLFLDSLDWGVRLFYPFSRRFCGLGAVGKSSRLDPEKDPVLDFVEFYLSDKLMLSLEFSLALIAGIMWLLF